MPSDTFCKTVRQYNKEPVSVENMEKLLEIAHDYNRVKNDVYERYGGIGSIEKLYPGYTVQNEMTKSGLREQLHMPSVYFYLAVFDALGDIKTQWSMTENRILAKIRANEAFTPKEREYLKYVLKDRRCFGQVLNRKEIVLQGTAQQEYAALAESVDVHRLDNYVRRQVRKCGKRLHTEKADIFTASERAYRYGDGGIYISAKEKRKRIFVPLTDNNRYVRQLKIRLFPEKAALEILVPIDVRIKFHADYNKTVGIAAGMFTMLTTDEGNTYGERLGEYVMREADWVREQNRRYQKNKDSNPGRKKYQEAKRKLEAGLHTYINAELNRFLAEEKPGMIFLPKLPAQTKAGKIKRINYNMTLWQRGYIRKRLEQKCMEQSVRIVEVFGKGIGTECSNCGAPGEKKRGIFTCGVCGFTASDRMNAARNAKKRGLQEE